MTKDFNRKDKLKHVKLEDITVSDRAREDFGDIEGLMESIKAKGLLQPITITTDGKLLAGGRRFRACSELGFLTIPAIIRESEDAVDAKEIELMENVFRKDFTWQERAKLTADIDELYRKKNPGWNQKKTSEILGVSVGITNKDLQLATAMKVLPEIREAKTADDAFKLVKKLEETSIVEELRKRQEHQLSKHVSNSHGIDAGVSNALKIAKNSYHIGDTFAGMAKMRTNGSINIIECDPPYGIDLNNVKSGSTADNYKEVDKSVYENFLNKLATELFRVAGKDCWLVFWFGPTWQHETLTALRSAGWLVDEIPAIWTKPNGQTLQPELYYARCYEPFYLCRKGKPVMVDRGRSNVFSFAPANNKYHPTQRPTDLIETILRTLSAGMATVFVPFLGSGATLRACFNLGMSGFGYDLDGSYLDKFLLAVEDDTRKLFNEE